MGRRAVVARPARSSRRSRVAPPEPAVDMAPGHYIVKVDRASGEPIDGPIEPAELLVHAHRDNHPVEIAAQFLASRLIDLTGNEGLVKRALRGVEKLATRVGGGVGRLTGDPRDAARVKRLLGVSARDYVFRFREPTQLGEREVKARVAELQRQARAQLQALGRRPRLKLLLTGATGFLGKEILAQAASHPYVAEVVAVVRKAELRDRKTKQVVKVLSARERGAALVRQLDLPSGAARRFRFVEGDVERPNFGMAPAELRRLERELTHVIHCAASVSFDDPYERSFRANVLGCRFALAFSRRVQAAPGSRFVAHVAIETSYIHGRRKRTIAQEHALTCPRHFYNNYYELTKAMASIETDRALVQDGLRVTQLLPSIVIGHARTGINRGDTKVLNAPVNAFGRAQEALAELGGDTGDRLRALLLGRIATSFPGDRSAELNLVPVDRVAAGILASLTAPQAIGARIHLATDNRIRTEEICRVAEEELGVKVRMSDPTLSRNLTLPLYKAVLSAMGDHKLAAVVEKLGTIFGVYGEWGQPIHDVGNDVRLLGLPIRRPETAKAFRMLCRHNKYVQEFAKVRDALEIARRERVWQQAIEAIEYESGREVSAIPAREFRQLLAEKVEIASFRPR